MNIVEWNEKGRPPSKYVNGVQRYTPFCDVTLERKQPADMRNEWYSTVGRACRRAYELTQGLKYSPSAQAYIGSGVATPADAYVPTYTPPPPPPPAPAPVAPATGIPDIPDPDLGPIPVIPSTGNFRVMPDTKETSTMISLAPTATTARRTTGTGSIGALAGTVVGGPIGGTVGGFVGSLLGGVTGGSKCPGPFNYDPATGGCVPKPDYLARAGGGSCPDGYTWDGSRCVQTGLGGTVARILPGGQSGTGTDVYGNAVMGAFGQPALVPATVAQPTRRCPTGLVLGKDNLCYPKGSIRNSDRKWPKAPRPALSAQDMKIIRKADRLKTKVKKAAMATGWSCRKR